MWSVLSKNENFFWITGGKSAFVDKSGPGGIQDHDHCRTELCGL